MLPLVDNRAGPRTSRPTAMTAPVQLIGNSLSSYVRKVLIFLRLKGI